MEATGRRHSSGKFVISFLYLLTAACNVKRNNSWTNLSFDKKF